MPVDWYNGGMEHVTRHLLYSRFWHQFLYDLGEVSCPEPYLKRTAQGLILGTDGEKMSKSRGNVVNPDDIIDEIGADAFRLYEMFMGAFDQAIPWSTNGAKGCKKFLDRVWRLQEMMVDGEEYTDKLRYSMHETIKKVSEDFEAMKFNTAIAQMMTLVNEMYSVGSVNKAELKTLLTLLNPVAPHMTEEIWRNLGETTDLAYTAWPKWDEAALVKSEVEIAVQVAGKIRGRIMIPADMIKEAAETELVNHPEVQKILAGKTVMKVIFVPGRLVNFIAK
jgi:leucyl-tRNA synthetase